MSVPLNIDLKNKVAVVTGGGGILCSSMAAALAECGAKVAILDLRLENAQKAAEAIKKNGGDRNRRKRTGKRESAGGSSGGEGCIRPL